MEKTKQMTLFVNPKFYQEVRSRAEHKGLSLSAFVRLTLRNELDKEEKKHEQTKVTIG